MRIDRFLIVAIIVAIVSAAKSIPRINRRRLFPLYNHEEVQAAMKKIGKDLRVCVCDMSIGKINEIYRRLGLAYYPPTLNLEAERQISGWLLACSEMYDTEMEQARIGKLPEVGGKLRADLPIPNERDLAATIVGPSGPAGLRDMNHGLMECLCKRKENNIDLANERYEDVFLGQRQCLASFETEISSAQMRRPQVSKYKTPLKGGRYLSQMQQGWEKAVVPQPSAAWRDRGHARSASVLKLAEDGLKEIPRKAENALQGLGAALDSAGKVRSAGGRIGGFVIKTPGVVGGI